MIPRNDGNLRAVGRPSGYHAAKRLLDVVVASAALVVFSPVMLVVAISIWLSMGRPVFFTQVRPGKGERPFTLLKFRTMSNLRNASGELLPDAKRMTRVGAILRKTSLDELPQLINVLRGDMSLVGPRPLLPEYLPFYSTRERTRHLVRPGITGLAQVCGRNNLSWDERLELDAQYVERESFLLDLKILLRTALKVAAGSDVQVIAGTKFGRLDHVRAKASDENGFKAVSGN